MKGLSQILVWIYGLTALYFLYLAAMGIFVYLANRSMGHYESFFVPGRNLAAGLILGAIALGGWQLMKNVGTHKIGLILIYLPFMGAMLFVLWFAIIFATNGGKWN